MVFFAFLFISTEKRVDSARKPKWCHKEKHSKTLKRYLSSEHRIIVNLSNQNRLYFKEYPLEKHKTPNWYRNSQKPYPI